MMLDDEQSIRTLIAAWHGATISGDLAQLLKLMADDVVFLRPGQPPMRGKDAFANSFRTVSKQQRIVPQGEVKELVVSGDLAYCWTNLSVTVTPLHEGLPMRLSGNTLTVLRKQAESFWVITRDANMLTPEPLA